MKMCHYTAAASTQSSGTIVFTAATVGSVGRNSSRLVNTAATILMLVAMLPSLACAGKPFKTKLIFSESHSFTYLARIALPF